MNAREALAQTTRDLELARVPSPRVDAEHLVCSTLGITRAELYAKHDRELDRVERRRLRELSSRRRRREPLAYVLGEWGFRRLTLLVDERVLVPRPETEIVVERCLVAIRDLAEPAVLDVGTGSGAIALALADEHPGARVTGIDASADALSLATANARRLGLDVAFERHDLRNGLPRGPYDLVVSNPPYVPAAELDTLAPEVRDWEPREALVDRGQTVDVVRAARAVLRAGGRLVLETHWRQAHNVARLAVANGYGPPRISEDLAGRQRVVEAEWER